MFVIGKYAYIFFGGGGFSAGGIFIRDNLPWGGKFPGGEFLRENLSELLYTILLMSYFLFSVSILCVEMLSVIVQGKFLAGLNCLENKSLGRRDFSVDE